MVTDAELKKRQELERNRALEAILKSTARKKIIVAGPGTGKTYTFKKVLELKPSAKNVVMTFIRKLTEDMAKSLGELAEVKTFHAYCKKVLHEQNGRVELVPYLTLIIAKDSEVLAPGSGDFDQKFRTLDEASAELRFYLDRGDYYEVVSFNDAVYRLYAALRSDGSIVPEFDQILIDEFQDFNPLEVAFIDELEKKGPIILVGDDDQAIYDDRDASPVHLRRKYRSGEYEKFPLPFCSRCTEAIVEAANAIIDFAKNNGSLNNRISKPYRCYIADKEEDNKRYPKIITARCTNAVIVARYVDKVIDAVIEEDIKESWEEGDEYPTILVVGAKQYLLKIQKDLQQKHPQLKYNKPGKTGYTIADGYHHLLKMKDSNIGWRILAEFFLSDEDLFAAIIGSADGTAMQEILPGEFVKEHLNIVEILRESLESGQLTEANKVLMQTVVSDFMGDVEAHFFPPLEEVLEDDKTKPSILLTSFKGCKGLSAGHVVIVGANDGSIPADPSSVTDVEIAQFIVALTRTKKRCHIISNKWLYGPRDNDQKLITPFNRSSFIDLIPEDLLEDLGDLNAMAVSKL